MPTARRGPRAVPRPRHGSTAVRRSRRATTGTARPHGGQRAYRVADPAFKVQAWWGPFRRSRLAPTRPSRCCRPRGGAGARRPLRGPGLGPGPPAKAVHSIRPRPRSARPLPRSSRKAPESLAPSLCLLWGWSSPCSRTRAGLGPRPREADAAPRAVCVSARRARSWKNKQGGRGGWGATGWGLEGSAQCGRRAEQSPHGSPVTPR